MNFIKNYPSLLFPLYLVLTLVAYASTSQAGFVTDFTGFQERLANDSSIAGALNSFGFPAIQPILNLVGLGMFKFFGVHSIGYYIVYCLVHALNAYLAFMLFKKILQIIKIDHEFEISILASALFLTQPYCTEALVWKVVINALLSTTFILIGLLAFLHYLLKPSKRLHFIVIATTILSILTFEYGTIQFLLCMMFYLGLRKYIVIKTTQMYSLVLPLLLCSIVYFLMVELTLGDWAGHSGAATHFNLDWQLISGNYFRFFLKYFFFLRYFSYDVKQFFFETIANNMLTSAIVLCLGIVLFIALVYLPWRRKRKEQDLVHFSFLMFCVGLAPVITMYHVFMFNSENDRHGYLASIFFSLLIVSLLFYFIKSMRGRTIVGLSLLCTHVLLQQKTANQWAESNEVYHSLLNDFRWYDVNEVYVMSVPDHFNGSYMFRTYEKEGSGLYDALQYSLGKKPSGRLIEISQFNMNDKSEGFKPSRTTSYEVSVEFLQWGNWWHRLGLGGVAYENEKVRVKFDGQVAKVKLLSPAKDHVVVYMKDMKWHELK